jgi:hypothetical protein
MTQKARCEKGVTQMRKPTIVTVASLGLLSLAGSTAWACDWNDGHGYRQSRVYGYSYAPRSYGYYAPVYGYRTTYLDDDDYDYGYGYGGVDVDVVRDRRFHRRHAARTAVNVRAPAERVRDGAVRTSGGREGSAMRGAAAGEGARAAGAMAGGISGGAMGRGGDGGGRR